jgi:transketolase
METLNVTVATDQLQKLANQLRVDSIRTASKAGSGHPTSAMSAAELMASLMANHMRYDFDNPDNPSNDHLIFSKGHASSLLYALYKAAGAISDDEMMTYREFGSKFQGHPTPAIPWVDVATGSLGQGLPIAVGVALAAKYLDKTDNRVWVLCGDSEMAEGSIWEAFNHASYYKLDNLTAIIDMNRLGQRGETAHGWDGELYANRARAFGWHAIVVDGHNLGAIDAAYKEAIETTDKPVVVIARTRKGAGVSFMSDQPGMHGKALNEEQTAEALEELGGESNITIEVPEPPASAPKSRSSSGKPQLPDYDPDTPVATRQAYGDALKALGAVNESIVVLDGEVSNSTMSEVFKDEYPNRFFEMFIAEQQMIAAAVGMSVRDYVPFASTFGAFMSRAYDFIRMAAISQANVRLCGSHAGVSIGEDGPSQMALEDIAMMRAVFGSTVLYPSDAVQTAQLVAAMAEQPGISYLRTTREKTPILYSNGETFKIGGSHVLRQSDDDQVTVVAAGITLHEAIKACDQLEQDGIQARLIDLYSVKPVDVATLKSALDATGNRLVVAEDHWPEGGIGSAVLEALMTQDGSAPSDLKMIHLAPRDLPGSGKPQEMLAFANIDAAHIADAVRKLAG